MEFKTLLNQIATLIQNLTLRQKIVAADSVVVLIGFLVFLTTGFKIESRLRHTL